jgi:hypothetical protein
VRLRLPQATQLWIISSPGTKHRVCYPQRNCWTSGPPSRSGYPSAESQCDGPVVEVRVSGWTVLPRSDGTRFANDGTGHGMFVSIENVYSF